MCPENDRKTAVIGIGLRLPGAATAERFWDNNEAGTAFTRRFGERELVAAGVDESDAADPEFLGASALLDDIAGFDAGCFGMSRREAMLTDPQHRLFLEVTQHALEDAGYCGAGERVAIFGGTGFHLHPLQGYLRNNLDGRVFDEAFERNHVSGLQVAFGNHPDFVATRAAFRLGLRGPAATVQTGCSTGLVALGLAAQALWNDEADLAVVATAAVHVPQVLGHRRAKGSVLSKSGVCRAFDTASDGIVTGNGASAVVLKRHDHARRDGDRMHATVLAVGVNNDGDSKQTYSAPSTDGQVGAIRRAFALAGVSPAQVGYLETHGTGTFKGDPIEFAAADRVWREHDWRAGGCALGSVKPAIGHLDSAAALPSLIKAIGVLRRGVVPPLPNFTGANPTLPLDGGPFRLPATTQPWTTPDRPRRAGVTALGIGGTNAHVILEEPPPYRPRPDGDRGRVPGVLPLSAADPAALRELAARWAAHLRDHSGIDMADLVTTAALGRRPMRHRLAVLGSDPDRLREALAEFAASGYSARCLTGVADTPADETPPAVPVDTDRELANRHLVGGAVDWARVLSGCGGRRIPMPAYPYQRKPHWIGPPPVPALHDSDIPITTGGTTMTTIDRILDHIRQATASLLDCKVSEVTADTAFTVLGADSLSMVNLARDLEETFAAKVSMRELFEVAETPGKLAELVAGRAEPDAPPEPPPAATATVRPAAEPPPGPPAAAEPPPAQPPPASPWLQPGQPPASPPPAAAWNPGGFPPAPFGGAAYPPVPSAHPPADPNAALAAAARSVEALGTQLQHMAAVQTQLMQQFSQLLAMQYQQYTQDGRR